MSQATGGGVVVAEAADPLQAAIWVDALHDAGIEAHSYERGVGAALGGASTVWAKFPVLVRQADLARARNVLAELEGAAVLAPYRDDTDVRAGQAQALKAIFIVAAAVTVGAVMVRLFVG